MDEIPVIERLLVAVHHSASLLHDQKHAALCTVIMGCDLWLSPQSLRQCLLELYVHLSVAQGTLVERVVTICCEALVPRQPPQDSDPAGPWNLPQEFLAAQRVRHVFALSLLSDTDGNLLNFQDLQKIVKISKKNYTSCINRNNQQEIVDAVGRIVQLVPTASSRVISVLAARAPFRGLGREHHCLYTAALVSLAEHPAALSLRDGLESLLIGHVIEIDCEIKWEDIVQQREMAEEAAALKEVRKGKFPTKLY